MKLGNIKFRPERFSYGAISAIISSVALIAGFHNSSTKVVLIGALLIIAIADNVSDSFGIHIYQESQCVAGAEVQKNTISNFIIRLLITLSFIGIVLILPPIPALIISTSLGIAFIVVLSHLIAVANHQKSLAVIARHLALTISVLLVSALLGDFITRFSH